MRNPLEDGISHDGIERKCQQQPQGVAEGDPEQEQGTPAPFLPDRSVDRTNDQILKEGQETQKRDAAAGVGHGDHLRSPEQGRAVRNNLDRAKAQHHDGHGCGEEPQRVADFQKNDFVQGEKDEAEQEPRENGESGACPVKSQGDGE